MKYSHRDLYLWKVSTGNLKFNFPGASEVLHDVVLKETVKIRYLDSHKLEARTVFCVFIVYYGLPEAHSLESKAN